MRVERAWTGYARKQKKPAPPLLMRAQADAGDEAP
jgi:hypothetical protein